MDLKVVSRAQRLRNSIGLLEDGVVSLMGFGYSKEEILEECEKAYQLGLDLPFVLEDEEE